MNKEFHTEILISSATRAQLPPAERAKLVCADEPKVVQVKGKEEPLRLYAVKVDEGCGVDAARSCEDAFQALPRLRVEGIRGRNQGRADRPRDDPAEKLPPLHFVVLHQVTAGTIRTFDAVLGPPLARGGILLYRVPQP